MSSSTRDKADELEAKARAAERDADYKIAHNARLSAAIDGIELYMQALAVTDSASEKKRLDVKTKHLLAKAELLKKNAAETNGPSSTRQLPKREQIIILKGSKLNGAVFKPWTEEPQSVEFQLNGSRSLFTDELLPSLSDAQKKHFAGWQRPEKALSLLRCEQGGTLLCNEPTMTTMLERLDLVQDLTSDCSVVASLCCGVARAEKGHKRILSRRVYPYDLQKDEFQMSENGKYVLRLYFNGTWRRVEIDDRLPTSHTKRVLHVVVRSQPGLLWPALLEKAYLKVRGGYDFPGSNSATDLSVLTGWIPQQIFLHDEDVNPLDIWEELSPAFAEGSVMVTLGTGKLGRKEQKQLGLAPEHDYAVLDMQKHNGVREILVKNPWADGEVWRGATRCRPHPGHESDPDAPPMSPIESEKMVPGTFWIDFDHVFQYFQNVYLNWNPSLFAYREDMHFSWTAPRTDHHSSLLVSNPQVAVHADAEGDVWLLLNRHFRTGDYTSANNGKNGYISLYLYTKHGRKVFSSADAHARGPFVDSPNTLLRVRFSPHETLTAVVLTQEMPAGEHSFTISALSNVRVTLSDAELLYQSPQSLRSAWTYDTAGGNSDSPRYLDNPQFALHVQEKSGVALVLRIDTDDTMSATSTDLPVKISIVRSDGRRLRKLFRREINFHSGDYRRSNAVIETTLESGSYTVICSTFEQNQRAKFVLDLYTLATQMSLNLKALPSERAGRFSVKPLPVVFESHVHKMIAPMLLNRTTKCIVLASSLQGDTSSAFRMSLERGQGPNRMSLSSTGAHEADFQSIAEGLRIEDIDLTPSMSNLANGGLWLVLERPAQSFGGVADIHVLQVEILAEERFDLGPWAPLDD